MNSDSPVVSVKPLALTDPDRGLELQVRITAPTEGVDLPVVLFSHGFGSSLEGYGPLTDHWAAHGLVVVQPTYLDSRTVGLDPADERVPQIWWQRVRDARHVLDELDTLVAGVPGLPGRVDVRRIAAAGHSFGGQTTGILRGLRVLPPAGDGGDLSDPRVQAAVLLATAGTGGDDLTPFAAEHLPYLNVDFRHLQGPLLVVAGDRDDSALTTRGPDWSADPYRLGPRGSSLLTLHGAEHSLGGIPGYEAAETTDENPAVLALLQRVTTAYLQTVLHVDPETWNRAVAEVEAPAGTLGHLESR